MNVVLFGASGMIGSRVLQELLGRGHAVTAVVRNPEKIAASGVKVVKGDINDEAMVAKAIAGADAVISAYSPPQKQETTLLSATRSLIAGMGKAGVRRLIVVGGAGSLEAAPGVALVDVPEFPAEWKPIARAHRDLLPILKQSNLEWTYLSPAGLIQPGERTGTFRLGGTQLLSDANGASRISAEDYAIALVDELEKSEHVGHQFTAAY